MDLTGAQWRKSSYSSGNGGNCVEVSAAGAIIAVRDSKDPHGPVLAVHPDAWRLLTDQVKEGTFASA